MSKSLTIPARLRRPMCGLIAGLILLMLAGCGGTPPTRMASEPYTILSEQPDPATGGVELKVRLSVPADQSQVKTIAEALIEARRKAGHDKVTVKTYASTASGSDQPFGLSTLASGAISHQFNPRAAETRIPTH